MQLFYLLLLCPVIAFLIGFLCIKKQNNAIFIFIGFVSGILIACTSFSLLPEAFLLAGFPLGFTGLLVGVICYILLENKVFNHLSAKNKLWIRRLTEGFIYGTLIVLFSNIAVILLILFALRNLFDGLVLQPSAQNDRFFPLLKRCAGPIVKTACSLSIGMLFGSILIACRPLSGSLLLALSGGLLLYQCCHDIFHDATTPHQQALSAIGALCGFFAGTILIAKL